ncbi:hypothetical protein WR25_23005 [Diploscapter pachys]|uniref:Uncharacterized protein n=1 Tax=Diploscapter pachys TaxID=2018661 RepID=A0A2A2L1K2_9BILA|nr:hypothetical protein WR25_23005 [Diploscapter pachys]
MWKKWANPPYIFKFRVWVYSVKNPDQIMAGAKPELSQMGPYTFDKKMENRVVTSGNGTVTFKRIAVYTFNESDSCQTCILGNRVWIPNMVYQKFVEAASTNDLKMAASTLISQTAFLAVEVGELLFEGYKDPFLDKICEIFLMNFVCESILDLPDRIGLFFEANNTGRGTYEVKDGTSRAEDLGKLVSYDGRNMTEAGWWSDENARILRGTEGSLFPPFIQKTDRIYVFVIELCRSIWLEFDKEVVVHGINAYRVKMPEEVMDSSREENKGFCNPTEKILFPSQNETEEHCLPKGLLEVSKCQRSNPPIVISMPNFLYADDEVKNSIIGLNKSDPITDSIYVDIEPRTGVVLYAQRRSQVNVELWSGVNLTFPVNLSKMRSALVPIIAVHDDAFIDDESLYELKSELFDAEWWAYTMAKLLLALSFIALVLAALVTLYWSGVVKDLCRMRKKSKIVATKNGLPPYRPNTRSQSIAYGMS